MNTFNYNHKFDFVCNAIIYIYTYSIWSQKWIVNESTYMYMYRQYLKYIKCIIMKIGYTYCIFQYSHLVKQKIFSRRAWQNVCLNMTIGSQMSRNS